VLLVHVQPLPQNLDCVSWEADAVPLSAARCIVSSSRCEGTAVSAVKCFDASEGSSFSAGQFVDRV